MRSARQLGLNPIVNNIWSKQIPLPNNPLGGDGYNTLGFLSTHPQPLTTNNYVGRIDHDFGEKEHFYRHLSRLQVRPTLTSNQVDIGGVLPGDKLGIARRQGPAAAAAFGLDCRIDQHPHADHHQHVRLQLPAPVLAVGRTRTVRRRAFGWAARSKSAAKPLRPVYPIQREHAKHTPALLGWPGQDNARRCDDAEGKSPLHFGGAYGRNFDYHSRSDNGAGVNNQISYLSTPPASTAILGRRLVHSEHGSFVGPVQLSRLIFRRDWAW